MNNKLVWLDLEMTGLDPKKDTILEIACVVTDDQLRVIAQAPTLLIKTDAHTLAGMVSGVRTLHENSGLLTDIQHATLTRQQAEQQLLAFLQEHVEPKTAPLCGNSIWMDKFFLKEHMPQLYDFFHYRTIDVSTIKELVRRWYPHDAHTGFPKKNNHRALDDVHESIAELRHYHTYFFKKAD